MRSKQPEHKYNRLRQERENSLFLEVNWKKRENLRKMRVCRFDRSHFYYNHINI